MPQIHSQNCSFPFDDQYFHLIHASLNQLYSPPQTASGSNQPFCHNTLSGPTNRQTDRPTNSVGNNSAYAIDCEWLTNNYQYAFIGHINNADKIHNGKKFIRCLRSRLNENFHQHVTILFSEVNGKVQVACNFNCRIYRLKDFSRSQATTYIVKRGNILEIVQDSDMVTTDFRKW